MTRALGLLLVLIAMEVLPRHADAAEPPTAVQPFAGRAYDIDYLGAPTQGWTQALLKAQGPGASLIAATRSPLLQAVLETSLASGVDADVTYAPGDPATFVSARVSAPPSRRDSGIVAAVACREHAATCTANVVGHGEVTTSSPRALGVLLTAMRLGRPVDYLQLDATRAIVRVKLNVPLERSGTSRPR